MVQRYNSNKGIKYIIIIHIMPGGLLNIVAYGNQNIILNGNPSKTFFKSVYAKYTNFGIQKFRIDYEGSCVLSVEQDSTYTFRIPRHAELLLILT